MKKLFLAIGVSGFIAITFLFAAFISGIIHLDVEIHEKLAYATVAFGLLHFSLILYKNHKVSKIKKQ